MQADGATSPASTSNAPPSKRGKKAGKACLQCRKAKRQCNKTDLESTTCQRCAESNLECVYEESLEGHGQARVELLERRLQALQSQLDSLAGSGQASLPADQPSVVSHQNVQSPTLVSSALTVTSPITGQAAQLLDHLAVGVTYANYLSSNREAEHTIEEQDQASLNAPYEVVADASNRPGPSAQATRASSPVFNLHHRPYKRSRLSRDEVIPSQHVDAVQTGLLTESEARQLFRGWMDLAREYVPILDPFRDTYERTRTGAPLVLDAILAIALCTSEVPDERASTLLKSTLRQVSTGLFAVTNSLSELQALAILSTWHDHAYISVGHGMRLAHSLKLPGSIDRLIAVSQARSHRSRTDLEREEEARLLAETRLFAHLWFMDISQSTMRNLPICNYGNEAVYIDKLRQILRHPAAITSDVRTTAMLENTAFRKQILASFPVPTSASDHEVVQKASEFLVQADQWYAQWDGQLFLPAESFPRCSLKRTAANTRLMIICHCLGHFLRKQRADTLPLQIHELLRKGQSAAEESVDIAITSSAYTSTWRHAGHPTLIDFAYSGVLALRLVHLLGSKDERTVVFGKIECLIALFRDSDDPFGCMKAVQYAYRRIQRKAAQEEGLAASAQLPFSGLYDLASIAQPSHPDELGQQQHLSMYDTELPSASLPTESGTGHSFSTFSGPDNDDFWSRMLRDIEQDIASQNDQIGPQPSDLDFWNNQDANFGPLAPSATGEDMNHMLPLGGAWGPW